MANCSNCSATGCSLCLPGFYLHNTLCKAACPNGTIPDGDSCGIDPCLYYNSSAPYSCLSCSSPYLLAVVNASSGERQCVLLCPEGTVELGSLCVDCPFNCLNCVSQSQCLVCAIGRYLYQGTCRYVCPVGSYQSQNECLACVIPFCLQCHNATTCTLCDETSGSALSNGLCLLNCPIGTYHSTYLS